MNNENNENLALSTAKRAMKIVIFVGMVVVVLLMINVYVLLNQITATAQMSKKLHTIEKTLESTLNTTDTTSQK
ncbi:DUF5408 family protein [Helicobacter fennelliae]|uniref:Uncharacterized protein n=1 Tax=Helicobacter fennelliae TaxID=215 RepID=A0A2X3DK56_9HELI|nr:DUF5408 family protein [Helicobacter fennelliae]SQB98660.1 Uncharacterised protein [Helicobacter fennelliae]STQ84090.1 Uncharacterised protein [Helicobacter fennelliae]